LRRPPFPFRQTPEEVAGAFSRGAQRWPRVALGNGVTAGAQLGDEPNIPPMLSLTQLLRPDVIGISIDQDQSGDLIHVEVGKSPHVVATEGAPHQNVGTID